MRLLLVALAVPLALSPATIRAQAPELTWGSLPDLPLAVSGQFAGVCSDWIVVAGGAHFPTPLFEGGQKVWVDTVYTLEPGEPEWSQLRRGLPRPLAYGATVSHGGRLICVGGGDAERHYADAFGLRWTRRIEIGRRGTTRILGLLPRSGTVQQTPLPALPQPCAFTSAALVGDTLLVAGGQDAPDATEALHSFWALDLDEPDTGWQVLDPWPGPARILPVAASANGAFYLFSGCELFAGDDGKAKRRYLKDAYRYTPGQGWERLADMPRPAVAAPTPAPVVHDRYILILGGDDGENADRVWELKDSHPGFRHDILAYDTLSNGWETAGEIPHALVTTTTVPMPYGFVIPGGEDRPGHRSTEVMRAKPAREDGG